MPVVNGEPTIEYGWRLRLTAPWGRDRQQGIPVTVEEIVSEGIACAQAGAAIVHVHAYDSDTGLQRDDADLYAAIIEGIRAEVDVIVYPSVPLAGDERVGSIGGARERFAAVAELGRRGLIEWAVVDPGSVNFERYTDLVQGKNGFIYRNSPADISEGLDLAERFSLGFLEIAPTTNLDGRSEEYRRAPGTRCDRALSLLSQHLLE
jgi:3-keto-5-aminohexanoate cleavage enzyme